MKESLEIRSNHEIIREVDDAICKALSDIGYECWAMDHSVGAGKPDRHLAFNFPELAEPKG